MLAIAVALVAAVAFAAATVLQQHEAKRAPGRGALRPELLVALARRPLWWAGLVADGTAYGCQALALGLGALIVVQPVLTLGVPLSLVGGTAWEGRALSRFELVWSLVLAAGVAAFLVLGDPRGGADRPDTEGWLVLGLVTVPLLAAMLLAVVRSSGQVRASLLGVMTGAIYGVTAFITKSVVVYLHDETIGVFARPDLYVLAGLGALAFWLNQQAFHAGSLSASLPGLTVAEPLVATVIGITMLHEHLAAHDSVELALAIVAVAAMVSGVVVLSVASAQGRTNAA